MVVKQFVSAGGFSANEGQRRFVTYWPTPASAGEAVAERINTMPKAMLSTSLTEAP